MDARKLAVIMFTDMVGYSKKVGTDEDVALRLLAEHNAILEEQIRIYGGNVIKTIGDSYMVDFDSVFNAVNCASDIQRALVTRTVRRRPSGLYRTTSRHIRRGWARSMRGRRLPNSGG